MERGRRHEEIKFSWNDGSTVHSSSDADPSRYRWLKPAMPYHENIKNRRKKKGRRKIEQN